MEKGEDVLVEARAALRQRSPFLGFVLEQVELHASSEVPTARLYFAAPSFVIEYNPAYLSGMSRAQQAAVLEHEVLHILHRHVERQGERDTGRWNIACDLSINAHIRDLPPGALTPSHEQRAQKAEEIYDCLPAKHTRAASCLLQAPSAGDAGVLAGAYRRLLAEVRQRFGGRAIVEALSRLAPPDRAPECGRDRLRPAGRLGVNWPDALSRCGRPRGRTLTLTRPDRRGLSHWGRRRHRGVRVAVAIDTSGSISPAMGAAFLAELYWLRPHCSSMTVIMADAAVRAVLKFEELAGTDFLGRGYTDFTAAIAHVNARLTSHDLMIYLTDGYAGLPRVRPALPLLWVITENRAFPGRPVVFAGAARAG